MREIIDNAQNSMLLKTMISSWRKAFRNPEMPFVMIQLPRINDPSKIRTDGRNSVKCKTPW